ncbi:MAG: response regulator [Calditrichaeota bacterium]|nr:MAG: response regulator [Calditrichota bacterium]
MKKRLLIVDDETRIRHMLAKRLEPKSYTVVEAESGQQAIKIIQSQAIDLVLLDQNMPEMDGLTTFEKIKNLTEPTVPVIMLTAHGSIKLVLTFLKAGGTDFEEKPIDFDILHIKIERALRASEKLGQEIKHRKDAEISLKKAHDTLEKRVLVRTAALAKTNKKLQSQIAATQKAEKTVQLKDEQLRQAQKMESIGRLAGGIAHDFNNILTAIIGYCDFLRNDLSPDNPQHEDVCEINKAAERATALTQQLLAFSRRQSLQPEIFDLNAIVKDLHQMLRNLISKNIRILLDLTAKSNPVKVDKTQMEQVILNLALNARDSMPSGGELSISVKTTEISTAEAADHLDLSPGCYVLLEISDSGKGIDEETQSHIFEPFFTTKAPGKGTGLGLSTVYGIVKQSDGHIAVVSSPDKGTKFTIFLPCQAETSSKTVPEQTIESLDGTETILFVEDEESVRNVAKRILEDYGYTVILANGATEAQTVLAKQKNPVHLLITDLVLPKISGPELAKQLSKTYKNMKVLYVSGYSHELLLEKTQGIESAFVQKPFIRLNLARRVREVLDQPKQ